MVEKLAVNAEILRWARKRAGYTVADMVGVVSSYAAMEKGEHAATYNQCVSVAKKLHIPVAGLFCASVPSLPKINETFRRLSEDQIDGLSPEIRKAMLEARAYQLDLLTLGGGSNPVRQPVTAILSQESQSLIQDQDHITLAVKARDALGVNFDEIHGLASPGKALDYWRSKLVDSGVFVFKGSIKDDLYSGFCLFDSQAPVIYVNNAKTFTRQIFTLAHELCHLILGENGLDLCGEPMGEKRLEVFCNAFAAEFLLPKSLLLQRVTADEADPDCAARIAQRFHVSREVVFRRFLDMGWIGNDEYQRCQSEWSDQIARTSGGKGGGDYYATKIAYLGRDYVGLVLQNLNGGKISLERAAEMMRAKAGNVEKLEHQFLEGLG